MTDDLSDLPDEVRELIEAEINGDKASAETLAALGIEIARKRDDAVSARSTSGIEKTWMQAEEAYLGIDDANRHEFEGARWAKPMALNAPMTTDGAARSGEHQSTIFFRMTARYVDAGAAKLGEILLPADDKAFSFNEMPVPELLKAKEDETQVVHNGTPATRPMKPGEALPPGIKPDAQGRVPLMVKDLALEKIEIARKKAKAAETRIQDWLIQGAYRKEVRAVIGDAARIGVGVLKGPVPKSKRVMALTVNGEKTDLTIKQKIIPALERKDPWKIYPDAACGENIHDGSYIFEQDFMSARQVRGLLNLPGYIKSKIEQVLDEGPGKINKTKPGRSNDERNKDRFEVWYFYGSLTKEEVAAINGAGCDIKPGKATDQIYAIVTLINDSVVKAALNPLGSGDFPYHSMAWQKRDGHWAGVGVAEQMRTPQRVTNGALRAMLDNAGKSADNQYVIDPTAIRPADDKWVITRGKIWHPTKDFTGDLTKAFFAIQIPNTTDQLMKIIEFGQQMAEESTSIPLITQGQSGPTTPDTLGATQLQNNNANQLLRAIGYSFDDEITEPVVNQCYEWLLMDSDVPNEEKGEYQIDAHGSAALVERAIQDQTMGQLLGPVLNPAYGGDPKKAFREFLASKKIRADSIIYTPEEQAKIDAAPPPQAPQVQVAQINTDAQLKLGVMKQQSDQQTVQAETQIEQAAQVLEGKRIETDQHGIVVDAGVKMHAEELAHQRAVLEYANRYRISVDQVKARLADTSMKLEVEKELNAVNQAVDASKHAIDKAVDLHKFHNPPPAVQVPGRARNGQASSQAGAG